MPINKHKTDHIIHAFPAFKDSETTKAIKTSADTITSSAKKVLIWL